jgi:hypothetical protein
MRRIVISIAIRKRPALNLPFLLVVVASGGVATIFILLCLDFMMCLQALGESARNVWRVARAQWRNMCRIHSRSARQPFRVYANCGDSQAL